MEGKKTKEPSKYSYMRINCNGELPFTFVNLDEFDKLDEYKQIRPLFSHYEEDGKMIYIGKTKYTLWCSNGKRYNVEMYFDEDGLSKKLLPNHRINAMINLGRFTSKKFDYLNEKTRNQQIKDCWGSNYMVGDVICKITTGKPIPDCSIFGDNPIKSIMERRFPNTRMKNKYGEFLAEVMVDEFYTEKYIKEMGGVGWERVKYNIGPKECDDEEYLELLKGWGIDWDDEE